MSLAKSLVQGLALALIVCLPGGCGREPIPTELMGNWVTSAPSYAGASMEITAETITFRSGKARAGVNRIISLEKKKDDDGPVYRIFYEGDAGVRCALSFYVVADGSGKDERVIIFKNQRNLKWTRTGNRGEGL